MFAAGLGLMCFAGWFCDEGKMWPITSVLCAYVAGLLAAHS